MGRRWCLLVALLCATSHVRAQTSLPIAPTPAQLLDENERLAAEVKRLNSQVDELASALRRSVVPLTEVKRQDALESLYVLRRALADDVTFPEFTGYYVDAARKTTALPDVAENAPIRDVLVVYMDVNALKLARLTQRLTAAQVAYLTKTYRSDPLIGRFASDLLAALPVQGYRPNEEQDVLASVTLRVETLSHYLQILAAAKLSAIP